MSRSAIRIRVPHPILSVLLLIALVVCGASPLRAQDSDHPLDAAGIFPARGSFGVLPWEQIDTYSGSLVLTFTDLVLPGNAGLDLRVSRVFNSKSRHWKVAVGPSMNLNRPDGRNPRIQTVDGGKDYLFESAPSSGVFYTTSLWRYTWSTYTLEAPDGRIYHFLTDGRLSQIADVFGNTIDVTYETNLTRVVQHLGSGEDRTMLLVQDDQGRVSAVQYGARTWTYTWGTTFADLTVTPPVGPSWTFQWQDGAPMAWTYTVTTPNGGWVRYSGAPVTRDTRQTSMVTTRESGGRAIAGATWSLQYSGSVDDVTVVSGPGRILRHVHTLWDGGSSRYLSQDSVFAATDLNLTNPLETRTYTYRPYAPGNPPGSITAVGLPDPGSDANPYPLLIQQIQTTRGSSTYSRNFTYCNESGQPACPADPVNDAGHPRLITSSGDDNWTRTDTYSYRHTFGSNYIRGRPSTITVATGTESWPASYEYDNQGFLLKSILYGVETDFTQDGVGNVHSTTDASNHTTSYTYDSGVRKDTVTPVYTITRAINADGTVSSETRQNQTESWQYDALGRVIQFDPRVGASTLTDYLTSPGIAVAVSRGGASTTQSLDGYDRPLSTVTAMGVTITATYDAEGRRVFESDPSYSSPAPGTSTQYDALDRVTRIDRSADNSWVTYAYDGLDVTITESVTSSVTHVTPQHWVATGSPAQARLVGVGDAAGQWTCYSYDALGALTAVRGPGAASYDACTGWMARRAWGYNGKHQLASETHPESGATLYAYDVDGTLNSRTDAAGVTTSYTYDSNHRLTLMHTTGRPDTTLTYDTWDNRTLANNGYVQSVFAYTAGKRLTSRTDTVTNQTFVTQYTSYDARDNLLTLVYPSGQSVAYTYDADNRITTVKDAASSTTYASGVSYHPSGGVAQFTAGNGLTHTIGNDGRARPTSVAAGPLSLTYTYDHLGNVGTLGDARGGMNQSFTYDALDRLLTASGGYGSLTYTYDALGNRSGTSSQATYDPATQRLTSTTAGGMTTNYGYDPNGSLTAESGARSATYTYTPDRMMETAAVNGVDTTYRYDADGQRTMAVPALTPTTPRYFIHGLSGQLLSEFELRNGTPAWQVAYVYLGSRLLAALRAGERLTVTRAGWGGGTVMSTPAGLSCGGTCAPSFYRDTPVALTATPVAGSVFVGWSGDADCSDGQVTMSAARNCTATFQPVVGVPRMSIDTPNAGAHVQPLAIQGWAIDVAAPTGTGVDTVHVWAYPNPGSGTTPIFLGAATYGDNRPDVGAAFGDVRFTPSSYGLTTTALAPNTYQIVVYAHSTFTGSFNQAQTVNISIPSTNPAMCIDIPGNGAQVGATFTIAGWAIDLNAPSGVGVDLLHIWAYPNGNGTPIFVGQASIGGARPDIGAYFGSQFTNSGWGLTASGLSPGSYLLVVYPHDTITGGFTGPSTVWVTVGGVESAAAGPNGPVGTPPMGGTVGRLLSEQAAWPPWLMTMVFALIGLTLVGLSILVGRGRPGGGLVRKPAAWIAVIVGMLVAGAVAGAQEVTSVPSALRAAHELLTLSYPELRASGVEMREVTTPDGLVLTFGPRGPADPALAAHTPPASPSLTAMAVVDETGRVRHLECRGAWTGLDHAREVLGTARVGVETRLRAAHARFGEGKGEDAKTEAQRLLERHGLPGARIDAARLQEAHGTVVWITRGVTETGEVVVLHLEPLTGKLIAFHLGGER